MTYGSVIKGASKAETQKMNAKTTSKELQNIFELIIMVAVDQNDYKDPNAWSLTLWFRPSGFIDVGPSILM